MNGLLSVTRSPHLVEAVVGLDFVLHILVGYTLVAAFTDLPPRWGALGGFVPNLDYPLGLWFAPPLVHRGLVHTPVFLAALALALLLVVRAPRAVAAFAIGYLAELALDTVEGREGIMWLYPHSTHHYAYPLPVSMVYWLPPVFVLVAVLSLHYYRRTRTASATT